MTRRPKVKALDRAHLLSLVHRFRRQRTYHRAQVVTAKAADDRFTDTWSGAAAFIYDCVLRDIFSELHKQGSDDIRQRDRRATQRWLKQFALRERRRVHPD
jgi:hypothetical protein